MHATWSASRYCSSCWCDSNEIDSYGTAPKLSGKSDAELVEIVKANFDLRPGCIVRDLQLRKPIFKFTAAYGHFGRDHADFTWEKPKELTLLFLRHHLGRVARSGSRIRRRMLAWKKC